MQHVGEEKRSDLFGLPLKRKGQDTKAASGKLLPTYRWVVEERGSASVPQ